MAGLRARARPVPVPVLALGSVPALGPAVALVPFRFRFLLRLCFAGRLIERDVDPLEALAALGLGLARVHPAVPGRQRDVVGERGEQRPRVQAVDPNDVDLHAEQHGHGGDVEERKRSEDNGEHRVRGAGVLDHVPHVADPERLQQLPGHGRGHRAGRDVAHGQPPRGRVPEDEDADRDVDEHRCRQHEVFRRLPERPRATAAHDGQAGRGEDGQSGGTQQDHAAAAGLQRVRPVVARDPPHRVRRVLEGLGHPEAAVQGSEDAHYQAGRAAAEVLRLAQLLADDRELGQRRGEHLVLQSLITRQDEAQDRRGEQEQREQRNERVVGEHPGQIAAEVVEELVDHRQRESRPPVRALKPVQTLRGRHTNRLTARRQALAARGRRRAAGPRQC